MKDISIQELKNTAVQMRMKVIDMIYKAQSGHPGGSLSAADFVTACYFKYMNVDPKNPRWPDRDRMVLSKGHVCPIQYACLASVGFFPEAELDTLRKEGSMLQGHPSMNKCPGIDISTGSIMAFAGLIVAKGITSGGNFWLFCILRRRRVRSGRLPIQRTSTVWITSLPLWTTTTYSSTAPVMKSCPTATSVRSSALLVGRSSKSTVTAWRRS